MEGNVLSQLAEAVEVLKQTFLVGGGEDHYKNYTCKWPCVLRM